MNKDSSQLIPFYIGLNIESDNSNFEQLITNIIPLADGIKDILMLPESGDYIASLGQSYGLSDDNLISLAGIIRDVLVGKAPIIEMPNQISSSIGIDMPTAKKIANKILSELMAPVIEDLKTMQRTHFGTTQKENPTQSPTTDQMNQNNIIDLKNK